MQDNSDFDLRVFLPYLLNQAAEESSLAFQQVYKSRYGMLRNEWRVLFHLGIFGELTAKDISERARMHKTKVSRAVQKLTDRRFVTRQRSPVDRRMEQLTLTAAGLAAYRELHAVAQDYDAQLMASVPLENALLLREILQKLARRTSQ
ncbi:MAG: MarR family winged helix-turn-helix transcriptional regulator [Sedimentitalea sp.]